ncbi:MAG: hypothetical protein KDA78_12835, partial [Planctomycetaceae bacterium]|nr:hypothetical protein [Planctomycetaceae bacterium]
MSKSPQQCAPAMQHPPRPSRSGAWIRSACGFLAAILIGGPPEFASLQGAEVTMLSGYRISFEGEPKPVRGLTLEQTRVTPVGPVANFPFTIFEDGRRQIILPQRQVAEVQLGGRTVDKFNITIPPGPKVDSFGAIGGFLNVTPFSEFGRRIVTLATPRGNEDVIQAIKELRPQDITLTAVQHQWEYKVATQSIPTETLRAVLYNAIDQESHE